MINRKSYGQKSDFMVTVTEGSEVPEVPGVLGVLAVPEGGRYAPFCPESRLTGLPHLSVLFRLASPFRTPYASLLHYVQSVLHYGSVLVHRSGVLGAKARTEPKATSQPYFIHSLTIQKYKPFEISNNRYHYLTISKLIVK